MKSAAILFVKNEFSDIAGWIYWYINLGFDKIVVFDDHSDDGTFEILESLKRYYNIDLYRSELNKYGTFYWRQRDAYMQASYQLREEYDWVIFLDGDEYLFFNEFDKVNNFLEKFEHADAIAINWCIFGSSYKALRNKELTPFNYFWRADETLGDACLVKSFVRPNKLNGNYFNPHKHEIISDKYYDAEGNIVDWQPGATKAINWENAKLMHYICRSMEHYSSRIRKRYEENSSDQLANWNRFNRNDVYDESSLKYKRKPTVEINFYIIDSLINSIRNKYSGIITNDYPIIKKRKKYKIYSIFDKNCRKLFVGLNNLLTSKKNKYEVYFISDDEEKGMIVYKDEENNLFPVMIQYSNYGILSSFFNYKLNDGFIELVGLFDNKYLSCNLNDNLDLEINRSTPSDWEKFIIKETDNFFVKFENTFDSSSKKYSNFIKWVCSSHEELDKMTFIFNLSSLERDEINKCFMDFPNLWFNII